MVSVAFALQAFAGNTNVWVLYALSAADSLFAAVSGPARRTLAPRLLPTQMIPAAQALTMMAMHLSMLGGPLLAGLVVPLGGVKACYVIDAVTFLATFYGVFRLPPMRPEGEPLRPGVEALLAGVRFVGRSRVLTGVLLSDITATLFAMPIALYPAINADRFGGSPRTLGLLSAGLAIGGIIGTVFSGPIGRVQRQGFAMLVSAAVWGGALTGFGLVHALVPTMAFLIAAGIADVISVVLRSTIVQVATPDVFRGRVNAVELMVGGNVPQLGNFRAGFVAQATSPAFSAASGGLMSLASAGVIGMLLPAISRFRAGDSPPTKASRKNLTSADK